MEPRLKVKIKYFIYKIFITISGCQKYEQEFQQSIKNPEEYWGKIAEDIVWTKKWQKVLDDSASPFTKWFVGGRLSLCYNALGKIALLRKRWILAETIAYSSLIDKKLCSNFLSSIKFDREL